MKLFIEILTELNTKIDAVLIYSVLPIVLTFALERFFIYRLKISAKMQAWASKQFWLEPNNISRSRYLAGIITVLVYHYDYQILAIYMWSVWGISDITDGSIAKILNKQSTIGEIIDPLSDKLLYLPPLFYGAFYLNILDKNLIVLFAAIDILGQISRVFSKIKAANLFGKVKTFMCVTLLGIAVCNDYYFQNSLPLMGVTKFLMLVLIVMAFCSVFFRIIPNYWYANILSALNLACGIGSISLTVMGYPLEYAFLLIFLGQFLDLLDGRAALKWGSTPSGDIIDDIGDGVNFGLAVSFIIYYSISNKVAAIITSTTYFICVVSRLYRFVVDKRADTQNKKNKNDEIFKGLPSPASALFVGSAYVLLNELYINFLPYQRLEKDITEIALALFSGLLMISKIPYIHAGRVLMKKTPNIFKVMTYSLLIFSCSIGFGTNDYTILMIMILSFSVFYLMFGQDTIST